MSRPAIPERIKREVWERDGGVCSYCGKPIVERRFAEFDHRPALWMRDRDHAYPEKDARHYVPNANDPKFIFALHGKLTQENCHGEWTFGDGLRLGDVQANAKHQRLLRNEDERQHAIALKEGREPPEPRSRLKPRRKKQWAKRAMRGWRNFKGEIVWAKPKSERTITSMNTGAGPMLTAFGLLLLMTPGIVMARDGMLHPDMDWDTLVRWLMSKDFRQWALLASCTTAGIFFMGCGLTMGVWG